MSLAQITEKIRNDAQKEADEILSKAKAQAEAITSKAEKECAGIQEGFDERFGAERPEIIKRREIVADIDVSKMMLSAKRELIEDVYRGALEKMKALPKDKYLAFCADLLDGGVTTKDELVVVGASRDVEALDQLENRLLEAAKRVGAQHAHLQRGVGQHREQALVDENERSAVQSEQLKGMEGVEVNVKGEAANILQSAEQTVVVPNLRIQRGVVGGVEI